VPYARKQESEHSDCDPQDAISKFLLQHSREERATSQNNTKYVDLPKRGEQEKQKRNIYHRKGQAKAVHVSS
jgi:hypothetical protein